MPGLTPLRRLLGRARAEAQIEAGADAVAASWTARDLRSRHLLLLSTTTPDAYPHALVRARHPETDLLADRKAQLEGNSRITGPHELTTEEAVTAGVPQPWTLVLVLDAEEARERERGLALLLAMARRLHGAVRTAGGDDDPGVLLQPDPAEAVDLLVHSPYWLEPDVMLAVATRDAPTSRLAVGGEQWAGADLEQADRLPHGESADDRRLASVHASPDVVDAAALEGRDLPDVYAVVVDLPGGDDVVEVLVHVADEPVPAVYHEPWSQRAGHPVVTYECRWSPVDAADLHARDEARAVVARLARAVVEATGGMVVDADGFPVDHYAL